MTVSVEKAAKYLCKKSDWTLSNVQLQKILYLADLFYLSNTNQRLIAEDFEAWDKGPVIPSLYHQCKAFGARKIPDIFWGVSDISGTPEGNNLDHVWEILKDKSPGGLIRNTHWNGGAWAKRYVPGARGVKISTEDMVDECHARIAASKSGKTSER